MTMMGSRPPATTGGTATPIVQSGYVDVRTQRGKLAFRIDTARWLIEWKDGPDTELIDLKKYLNV